MTHHDATRAHHPIATYAADVSAWEEWQRAYRYGIFLIYPPEPLRSQVNALRAAHDPYSQAICDAHITLTRPLPQPIAGAHWRELQALAATIAPFTIRYGPLRHYLPAPGVCLRIEPQELFDRLVAALESASVFAGAPPRRYPFSAHMTIAEFISAERTLTLMEELAASAPEGSFACGAVACAAPDARFHFSAHQLLPLG
jgi:2'-5' RNA ligase